MAGPVPYIFSPVTTIQSAQVNADFAALVSDINALPNPAYLGDNRIINGDMLVDQRNNGASGTASGYTVDRWIYGTTQVGKITWQRIVGGALAQAAGVGRYLNFLTSAAFTPGSTDTFFINQPIEASMVTDFAWGTPNAQPVTLSFWAVSSLTGIFSGSVKNAPVPATRSYPFTFSIPVANVWTKIVITIPGDTAGTWVMSGNVTGLSVSFDLGCGADFRAPAGAWASGAYLGANGAVSIVSTLSATFVLSLVKLEIGQVATPFNQDSLAKRLADCQRYYQTYTNMTLTGYNVTNGSVLNSWPISPAMRTTPTIGFSGQVGTNMINLVTDNLTSNVFGAGGTIVSTGYGTITFNLTYSSEL
jgi:hypothetical protein